MKKTVAIVLIDLECTSGR
jgi:hypothetical protein